MGNYTNIHDTGARATQFWSLLANPIIVTQVVEDGTLSSLLVHHCFWHSLIFH